MGRKSGVVSYCQESVVFSELYKQWFLMKMNSIKPQSLDRIECTYNRYYKDRPIESCQLHKIDTSYVLDFMNATLINQGTVTQKEYKRIYQIINNVLVYALDLGADGSQVIDWGLVRRYLPSQCIVRSMCEQNVVSDRTIQYLERKVIYEKVYVLKQSACLCLLLNFYLGLRVGELASLRWCDVDFLNGVLHVHATETKSYKRNDNGERCDGMRYTVSDTTKTHEGIRDIPLTDNAYRILYVLKSHHRNMGYTSEYLAYDGNDSTSLVRSLDRTLRRLCKLCEVLPFTTHMIRKTFASKLHDSGMPTRMISDLLGHREMSTTEKYYILSYADEIDRMRKAMNDIFDNSGQEGAVGRTG